MMWDGTYWPRKTGNFGIIEYTYSIHSIREAAFISKIWALMYMSLHIVGDSCEATLIIWD